MSALLAFAAVVTVAALVASRFKPDAWYQGLNKPAWNPPNWLFAPVWLVLYVAIAFAGWLVWWANADSWSLPLTLWSAQMVLNGAWSWLFFGRHDMKAALIDIVLMLCVIVAFAVTAADYSPAAAWLFVPYAIWVTFAAFLNFTIWRLNGAAPLVAPGRRMDRIIS